MATDSMPPRCRRDRGRAVRLDWVKRVSFQLLSAMGRLVLGWTFGLVRAERKSSPTNVGVRGMFRQNVEALSGVLGDVGWAAHGERRDRDGCGGEGHVREGPAVGGRRRASAS